MILTTKILFSWTWIVKIRFKIEGLVIVINEITYRLIDNKFNRIYQLLPR